MSWRACTEAATSLGFRGCTCFALLLHSSGSDLGELVVVEREVGNGVVVSDSDGRIVRIHRSEKLLCGLAQDEVLRAWVAFCGRNC
jgi:hypothetical protein